MGVSPRVSWQQKGLFSELSVEEAMVTKGHKSLKIMFKKNSFIQQMFFLKAYWWLSGLSKWWGQRAFQNFQLSGDYRQIYRLWSGWVGEYGMLWKLLSGALRVVRLPGRSSMSAKIRTMSRNWGGGWSERQSRWSKSSLTWLEPWKELVFYLLFTMYLILSSVHGSKEDRHIPWPSGVCVLGELSSLRIKPSIFILPTGILYV